MTAVPGEAKVMETLRGLNVRPGDYRFPYSNSVDEMKTPEFEEKMKQVPWASCRSGRAATSTWAS